MTPEQAEHVFSEWLSQQGFGDDHRIPADSQWHNFDVPGDRPGSKHGSAKLNYGDKIDGVFKTFNGIDPIFWNPGNGASANFATDEERQAWTAKLERKAQEKKQAQEKARKSAQSLYKRSKATTVDHPYLSKKKIKEVGPLKADGEDLLVPIYNARTDKFQTIQRITPDGAKLYLTNGVKAGGYAILMHQPTMSNLWDGDQRIVICEGYATAYAIQSAVPRCRVIIALDCSNLIEVAKILHDRFPLRDFIIAADNDIHDDGKNPGVRDATRAALAIGRKIAVPPPKPDGSSGDFWDLWNKDGDAAVKKLIDEAGEPTAEIAEPLVEQDSPTDESPQPPLQQAPPPKQQTQQTKQRNGKAFSLVCAKDIIIKPKDWLWEGHLLRGALELLSGIPALGKSQLQISYIACVTAGLPWPNGYKAMSPANIIMLTAEDTLDQEVVPRLLAAGANLERVRILKCIKTDGKDRQFLLGEDLDTLERAVNQISDVALIAIDPITAYMGGKIDSHKTTEVRTQLGPLKDFAEKVNVATSAITHPAKNPSQQAIDQFIGSQAFIAAARIGHVCIKEVAGEDDKETGRILFTNAKNNPHTMMPTLAYRIVEATVGQDEATRTSITAPHIVWEGSVNITANEAVRAASNTGGGKKNTEQKQVQAFLKEILSGTDLPVLVKVINAEGHKRGFSNDQLRLAREKLGNIAVIQTREGWTWQWVI